MKSLTFTLLLFLVLFQVTYTQESFENDEVDESEVGNGESEVNVEVIVIPTAVDWLPYDLDTFNNNAYDQRALAFGAQWIISQLYGFGIIASDFGWNVSTVNFVNRSISNGVNYAINCVFENDEGDSFTAELVINSGAFPDRFRIIAVAYSFDDGDVQTAALEAASPILIDESAVDAEVLDGEEAGFEAAVSELDDLPILVRASERESDEVISAEDWEEVDIEEAQNDPNLNIELGVENAIANGLENGFLSGANWELSNILQVKTTTDEEERHLILVSLSSGEASAKAAIFYLQALDGGSASFTTGIWSTTEAIVAA